MAGLAEYIERETFLKDIEDRYCLPCKEAGKDYNGCRCRACWVDDMRGDVIDAPAADVVPVVHGRWGHTDLASHWYGKDECSACTYHENDRSDLSHFNYCPNCGAKMDGGDGNDDAK